MQSLAAPSRIPLRFVAGLLSVAVVLPAACSADEGAVSGVVESTTAGDVQSLGSTTAELVGSRSPDDLAEASYEAGAGAVFVGVAGPTGASFAAAGEDGDMPGSPARAPIARPTSWDSELGVHTTAEAS